MRWLRAVLAAATRRATRPIPRAWWPPLLPLVFLQKSTKKKQFVTYRAVPNHRSHFGSRYKTGCCVLAGLMSFVGFAFLRISLSPPSPV
jgi:hypothetical protein